MVEQPPSEPLHPDCVEFVNEHLSPIAKANLERLNVARLDQRNLLYLTTALLLEARLHRHPEPKVMPPNYVSPSRLFCSFTAITSAFGLAILAFSGLTLAVYFGFSLASRSAPAPLEPVQKELYPQIRTKL